MIFSLSEKMFKNRVLFRRVFSANIFPQQERKLSGVTDDYILKSKIPVEDFTKGNLTRFLLKEFSLWDDKVALRCMVTERSLTYAQLRDQITRWSGFLQRMGLRQGDTIAIFSPNCPEYIAVLLGSAAIGVVTSTMSSLLTSGEISYMLKITNPKLVVYSNDLKTTILQALNNVHQAPTLVSIGHSKESSDLFQILNNKDIPFKDPIEVVRIIIPTGVLQLLASRPDCNAAEMPHLKSIMCGGAAIPVRLVELIKEKLGHDIFFQDIYGMTEILLSNWTPCPESPIQGNLKLMAGVEAKIVDVETGLPLPPNKQGEICVRTPTVMKGYINNIEATKQVLKDGWLHTGDIGYYDDQESFYFVDRLKELIKVEGFQVSPSEIEEVLLQHPKVKECSVVRIKDKAFGEAPKAFIIKKGDVKEQDIHDFLKIRLAKFKQLTGGIQFVDDFPRSSVGKVLKGEIMKLNP